MFKKLVKLAVIRDNDENPCPFGLDIPFACSSAGEYVDRMAPVNILGKDASTKEKELIKKSNNRLLVWAIMQGDEEPSKCKYAAKVFPDKEKVDCSFGDTGSGETPATFLGSPYYSRNFSGIGTMNMTSIPLGYYVDGDISRNLFYGITSFQSKINKEQLLKAAKRLLAERMHKLP